MVTVDDVRKRLDAVMDPCSVAMRTPTSVHDMGLIRSIDVEAGRVSVVLGVTTPLCHMVPFFLQQVDEVLSDLPGVSEVHCEVDQRPGWTDQDMTPAARERIKRRFDRPTETVTR